MDSAAGSQSFSEHATDPYLARKACNTVSGMKYQHNSVSGNYGQF